MSREQELKPPKPIPVIKFDYLPPGSSDPTSVARKGMIYSSERWFKSMPPESARRWLKYLRDQASMREQASPTVQFQAPPDDDFFSDQYISAQLRDVIDALLASVEDDKILGLACDLVMRTYAFTAIEGANNVYAYGEKMSGGSPAKNEKDEAEKQRAFEALESLKKVSPVILSKKTYRIGTEMLERGDKGRDGGITDMKLGTLRGHIDSFLGRTPTRRKTCAGPQSRT
jgi:hypothetical protein